MNVRAVALAPSLTANAGAAADQEVMEMMVALLDQRLRPSQGTLEKAPPFLRKIEHASAEMMERRNKILICHQGGRKGGSRHIFGTFAILFFFRCRGVNFACKTVKTVYCQQCPMMTACGTYHLI